MISSARSEPGIPVRPADLDADPWLFNCPNGTVNLRNGDLLPHNRADNITKLAGAPYIHGSESPLLQSVLNRCMGGNDRLIAFLQRLCGYALTGDTSEQILPIFYGIGQNGQGTLTETLRKVLADYARNADIGTFLAKHNEEARHVPARLKGARLVTATETAADSKLAEALVKRITGEDPVTCRHLTKAHSSTYHPGNCSSR
jgi:putative DNA primase/helicase